MGLRGTGRERGHNFDMDDWLSGHHSTGALPNFANSPEDQEGLMPTKVVDDWTPDKELLKKGGSSKGGLPPSLKGASDLPGVGLPVGTLPELPKLGENGAPGGVPGLEIPTGNLSSMLDMLEAQVGSQNSGNEPGQIVILGHGGRGTKGGHLNSGTEKKGAAQFSSNIKGLPGISTGASSFPGAGIGVGKLPELPKLSDNGASFGLPGAQAPTGKVSDILDVLEAQVGSQKNEPGQIEILGHRGIGTKYFPPVASTDQMPIEAYPDVYGTYSAQWGPLFGESFIPFGYPTVYPTPYVPMTDMWGQPYGLTFDLQAQQEPEQESGVPASPTPVSNQSAQKNLREVSKSEVKGAVGSSAKYKMTAGSVPVAKNYTLDGSSPDSS
ncbi:hypothetical protein HPB50_000416 [Hyalomma asiaticum]|uniref:Uncharacterized protein n=1 Tax=Hyalomma asiaticum TaxID=266040 RepID=A0ACB7RNR9_HYAAI|nr:hypothetical protein HPB50_000416 [Hyalomma asiaticum]